MKRESRQKIEQIEVDIIEDDGTRLRRSVHEDTVTRLMQSMQEIGLKTPIVVRHYEDRPSQMHGTQDSLVLVVGGHRLEAAKRVGWKSIDCFVLSSDDDDRDSRLWEIAENLDRSELTQLERKEHIAEWVRLTDDKLAHVAPVSKGGRGNEGGVRAATRELGVDRTEAQRSIQVAKLAPEAKQAARDLHLDDNQSALLKASREPSPERQLASLKQQADAAELARQNRETNKAIAATIEEDFARWIMGNIGLNELPMVIDWLEGSKPKGVIAALRRLTSDPPPIMDIRYGDAA